MKVVCYAHEKLVASGDSNNTSPYQAIPILICSNEDGSLKDRIFPFGLPSHTIPKKQK